MCQRCGQYPALVTLERFDPACERLLGAEHLCAGCWTPEARRLESLPEDHPERAWRAEIPTPGFSREAVERTLALEATASPPVLAEDAQALVAWVITYRRQLPPPLEDFVRRHRVSAG